MNHKQKMYNIRQNLKNEYIKEVSQISGNPDTTTHESDELVTVYHGTSTKYLNSILKDGILPRNLTGNTNWHEDALSIPNVTYMTDKWHYLYAINAVVEHGVSPGSFPCYIECKVPKRLLVIDEDFIHSEFMNKKIERAMRNSNDIEYDPMECLTEYGTVGVLGSIPPSMMVSFSVLADGDTIKNILKKSGTFMKDWMNWQKGKGKGQLTLRELWKMESSGKHNGTWWLDKVDTKKPLGFIINQGTDKLAITDKQYADQFNAMVKQPI